MLGEEMGDEVLTFATELSVVFTADPIGIARDI